MPGTFSQIYIQIVLVVKGRKKLIQTSWGDKLHKYITGIVTQNGQKLITIYGISDHIHILIGMKPSCCLSDLVREIKKSFNTYIKEQKFSPYEFHWHEGYGAFSYSPNDLNKVYHYVMNQKSHHAKKSYEQEYIKLMKENKIENDEKYLF